MKHFLRWYVSLIPLGLAAIYWSNYLHRLPILGLLTILLICGLIYGLQLKKGWVCPTNPSFVLATSIPYAYMLGYLTSWGNTKGWFLITWLFFIVTLGWTLIRWHCQTKEQVATLLLSLTALGWMGTFFTLRGAIFSPDSYSYYDIAQSIGHSFGKVYVHRQYLLDTPYNLSFPYLYPLLVALVNTLSELKIYSGVIVNLMAITGTVYLLFRVSKRLTGSGLPAATTLLLMAANMAYLDEAWAARSIPLSVFCTVGILAIMTQFTSFRWKHAIFAGLLAGAGCVIRFDYLALYIFFIGFFFLLPCPFSQRIRFIGLYLLGSSVFIAPWVLYSFWHFGTPWATDNGGTAFLTELVNPLRYYLPSETPSTLWNHPDEWFTAFIQVRWANISRAVRYTFWNYGGACVFIPFVIGLIGTWLPSKRMATPALRNIRWACLIILFFYGLKTMALILVGYGDSRYHSETFIILGFVSQIYLYLKLKATGQLRLHYALIPLILFGFCFQFGQRHQALIPYFDASSSVLATDLLTQPKEAEWLQAVIAEDETLFVMGGLNPYQVGVYAERQLYPMMTNIAEDSTILARLIHLFETQIHPDWIIFGKTEYERYFSALSNYYNLQLVDGDMQLYRVVSSFH